MASRITHSTIVNKNKIGLIKLQTLTNKQSGFLHLYIPRTQHNVWLGVERTLIAFL